jgi:hypothetical protein
VTRVLSEVRLDATTLDSIMGSFHEKRKEIVKRVQLQITKLPKSSTSSIKLLSMKEKESSSESE